MQNTESYISVHKKEALKNVQHDSSENNEEDEEAEEAEHVLVSQTRRFYSRQQYTRKLRTVRIILASGRPNAFYEELIIAEQLFQLLLRGH